MFALRLGSPVERARHDAQRPGIEIWRDDDGSISAIGKWDADERWLSVPSVGEFWIDPARRTVEGRPESGVHPSVVEDAFQRIVLPLAEQAAGREVLHASAVLNELGVVAFCARSGTGKSTIAWALQRFGFRPYADDAVLIESQSDQTEVVALPFRVSLRAPSADFLGAKPGLLDSPSVPERALLRGIFTLARQPAGAARARRLQRAEALTAILPHAYCFTLADAARKRSMVDAYLDLVTFVPVVAVSFAAELEELPELTELIAAEIGRLP